MYPYYTSLNASLKWLYPFDIKLLRPKKLISLTVKYEIQSLFLLIIVSAWITSNTWNVVVPPKTYKGKSLKVPNVTFPYLLEDLLSSNARNTLVKLFCLLLFPRNEAIAVLYFLKDIMEFLAVPLGIFKVRKRKEDSPRELKSTVVSRAL